MNLAAEEGKARYEPCLIMVFIWEIFLFQKQKYWGLFKAQSVISLNSTKRGIHFLNILQSNQMIVAGGEVCRVVGLVPSLALFLLLCFYLASLFVGFFLLIVLTVFRSWNCLIMLIL